MIYVKYVSFFTEYNVVITIGGELNGYNILYLTTLWRNAERLDCKLEIWNVDESLDCKWN